MLNWLEARDGPKPSLRFHQWIGWFQRNPADISLVNVTKMQLPRRVARKNTRRSVYMIWRPLLICEFFAALIKIFGCGTSAAKLSMRGEMPCCCGRGIAPRSPKLERRDFSNGLPPIKLHALHLLPAGPSAADDSVIVALVAVDLRLHFHLKNVASHVNIICQALRGHTRWRRARNVRRRPRSSGHPAVDLANVLERRVVLRSIDAIRPTRAGG